MTHVANRFAAVLDANVLYPFRVRDLLLRFAEAGLFRLCWSRQILNEWERSLLASKPQLEASIRSQRLAMEEAFPEALVDGHEPLINALDLPDSDDRHVLAAAICAGAQLIVTENLRDFPEERLAPFGIEARSADAFLAGTFELYPTQATLALKRLRAEYSRPPMTASELVMDLLRVRLPLTAAMARERIELL
jgi:predicted nucleic acid-binding protein